MKTKRGTVKTMKKLGEVLTASEIEDLTKETSWHQKVGVNQLKSEMEKEKIGHLLTPGLLDEAGKVMKRQILIRSSALLFSALVTLLAVALLVALVFVVGDIVGIPGMVTGAVAGVALGAVYTLKVRQNVKTWVKAILTNRKTPLSQKVFKRADFSIIPAQVLLHGTWSPEPVNDRFKNLTSFAEWERGLRLADQPNLTVEDILVKAREEIASGVHTPYVNFTKKNTGPVRADIMPVRGKRFASSAPENFAPKTSKENGQENALTEKLLTAEVVEPRLFASSIILEKVRDDETDNRPRKH